MDIENLPLEGAKILKPRVFEDYRGRFVKTFSKGIFDELGVNSEYAEFFYSFSNKNVIRGMHFQLPPYDVDKLVFVTTGKIVDVILDLRESSPSFKKYCSVELSAKEGNCIFIPKGFAHGFLSLENETCVNYLQSNIFSPQHDTGIKFDSFGFDWNCDNPQLSPRDLEFVGIEEFETPF